MEITVYRTPPLSCDNRHLPAANYNLMHGLFARSPGAVFVPIRPMQYLAIIDAEEVIFVDHLNKSEVEIAWRGFRPQSRQGIGEPVPYECCLYRLKGRETMGRLQGEFLRAMQGLAAKDLPASPARVLKFDRTALSGKPDAP